MAARRSEEKWEPIDSLGTTGATVARNIRRVRLERGLAYTELAEQLEELGREVPTWGLRKIESGGRRVDVDDLMALAVALRVSPITLLMPHTGTDRDEVTAAGLNHPVSAANLWTWLRADRPMEGDDRIPVVFYDAAWPAWWLKRHVEHQQEALKLAKEAEWLAQRNLVESGWIDESDPPDGNN
ncbi:MAG: helix-turn-helix transcriptional regulator [Dietzia sp.]|nr:helix-turn-helix transcriptional regulator [Dietzia sp.]